MLFGTPSQFLLQTALADALSSPVARNAKGLGVPIFDYYADRPDEAEIFRATMRTSTLGVTDGIVRSLDTTSFDYAVDVRGADGALLHSLMKLNPKLRGAVLERAEVANAAAAAAADRGVADRAEALAGDFFEEAPAADLYLLRFILHDWNDAKAVQILANCRRSMKADAHLIVIEAFLPEVGEDVSPTMLDTQVGLIAAAKRAASCMARCCRSGSSSLRTGEIKACRGPLFDRLVIGSAVGYGDPQLSGSPCNMGRLACRPMSRRGH